MWGGVASDLKDILSCGVCIITKIQEGIVQMRPNQDEVPQLQRLLPSYMDVLVLSGLWEGATLNWPASVTGRAGLR